MLTQNLRLLTRGFLTLILTLVAAFHTVDAMAVTRVGNADEGQDLEGLKPITTGKIFSARERAVERLKTLHVEGVRGLGTLIQEVEKSTLYMSSQDAPSQGAKDSSHMDTRGFVYARTFAEPQAATRFFPVAESLSSDQLVALHIHEGLHRSLPADVREKEDAVSQLTLAITGPDSSNDRVTKTAQQVMPETEKVVYLPSGGQSFTQAPEIPENASIKTPSTLAYRYRWFSPNTNLTLNRLKSMHEVQAYMYPFGNNNKPIGIGINLSFLRPENDDVQMGPLGLSGRMRLWSGRGFDVGAWAQVSLNTLSSEEMKNSPFGRNVYSMGLSMKKELPRFVVETSLGWTNDGESKQTIGQIEYQYTYGSIVTANIRGALRVGAFQLGGYGQLDLANNFISKSDAFNFETGAFYIASVGPEVSYRIDDLTFTLYGRYIAAATKGANFDYLGDVLGRGSGQSSIGGNVALNF